MKKHSSTGFGFVLLAVLASSCNTGMESYLIDPELVGEWELLRVRVGAYADYGVPMTPEEYGVFILLTLEETADFHISYIYPDEDVWIDGRWSVSNNNLKLMFSNDVEQTGVYPVTQDQTFTYGTVGLGGKVVGQYESSPYLSFIFEFRRQEIQRLDAQSSEPESDCFSVDGSDPARRKRMVCISKPKFFQTLRNPAPRKSSSHPLIA